MKDTMIDIINTVGKVIQRNVIPATKNGIGFVDANKGISLLVTTLIFLLFAENALTVILASSILYIMILLRELLDHKKENDAMKLIDTKFFDNEQKNMDGPLDAFVDTCLNEQLIMTRGWKEGQYITKSEEDQMMQDMIDMMARNMGPLMKKKLELYYGPGMVDAALVRKAYIKISLYVANTNKVLYVDTQKRSKSSTLDDMLREAMMMTQQSKVA